MDVLVAESDGFGRLYHYIARCRYLALCGVYPELSDFLMFLSRLEIENWESTLEEVKKRSEIVTLVGLHSLWPSSKDCGAKRDYIPGGI